MKILFLLKKNSDSGSGSTPYGVLRSGLYNSCKLLAQELQDKLDVNTIVEIATDGNEIDKFLHKHRPTLCILEAIWAAPSKLAELHDLYPHTTFIVRIHSRIPFLAMEGMSITWIKEYVQIPKVFVGFNNDHTHKEMVECGIDNIYVPNLYPVDNSYISLPRIKKTIDIGCFGAIRPLKNQLLQAVGAISYGEDFNKIINFHVNAGRLEQKGDSVLKNLRALFEGTAHTLVEHPWMEREEFLELVSSMHLGLQVSMSESFNIVTADFVKQGVPIIVSEDISWMPSFTRIPDNSGREIKEAIRSALNYRRLYTDLSRLYLQSYNRESLKEWEDLLS